MLTSRNKTANLIYSWYSFLHSTISGKVLKPGMPLMISAELTNHCNLGCPECYSGSGLMQREKGFMDLGIYRDLIKELKPYLFNINLFFQGESMLHPDFFSFIRHSQGIITTVSTNGHYLTGENAENLALSGLNKLIISMDGFDQEIYSGYRKNGELDKVIKGIDNVINAKKRFRSSMEVEIQFLVNRFNEHQIGLVRQFARDRGTSLKLKSMQIITSVGGAKWLPSAQKFRRYKLNGERLEIKSRLPNRCMRLWFNPVVTWDGKVVPCCFDKDASYGMGDLNLTSFRDIWYSKEYNEFRKRILNERNSISMCRNCTAGLRGVEY